MSKLIDFINKANIIHNNKYDYSKVQYINNITKIIICPTHSEFRQRPDNHKSGKGCQKCGKIIAKNSTKDTKDDFIKKSQIVHQNKYDYSKVNYINDRTKVIIVCLIHGEFKQTPHSHKKGGCQKCSVDSKTKKLHKFIEQSTTIHNNKYDYSKVVYINNITKIIIICPIHGEFEQTPVGHSVYCNGCPSCRSNRSQQELNLVEKLKEFSPTTNEKNIIPNKEIDIYFPNHKLGIEVNGLYWHRDEIKGVNYHQNKSILAQKHNIKLLQFWEHELNENWDIVLSIIRHNLKLSNKVYARQCNMTKLTNIQTKHFINNNHIQGHKQSFINYGLIYNDKIVTILSLSKNKSYEWEIIRFCSIKNYCVIGGFSKLFKKFIINHNPNSIITRVDYRYSTADIYLKNHFKILNITRPNHFYHKGSSRNYNILTKQQYQKHKLQNSGYHKISDSGNIELIWNKNAS